MLRLLFRIGIFIAALVGVAVIGLGVLFIGFSKPRPATGDEAAATPVIDNIYEAIDMDGWKATGAIRWTFAGRHKHLWDRKRGFSQVEWGNYRVLQRLDIRYGRAYKDGVELQGDEAQQAIQKAWTFFINDSFWLQPFGNLDSEGVKRSIIPWEEQEALLIEYSSGGVTPGDAYVWLIDSDTHLPYGWYIWASILPLKGTWTSWEAWKELTTGVHIATKHSLTVIDVELTDLGAAPDMTTLVRDRDPFEPLLEEPAGQPSIPASQPTENALPATELPTENPNEPPADAPTLE